MSTILTCNSGSSSIKLGVFESSSLKQITTASVENIGQGQATFIYDKSERPISAGTHTEALQHLFAWFENQQMPGVIAIGHRIVHGAGKFDQPTIISSDVIAKLQSAKDIDPDHMPAALEAIDEAQRAFPVAKQIACFDTAFFHDLPKRAQLFSLPRKYYEAGLRRYGFHGLSYQYLLRDFESREGGHAARGKVVLAHLGSGASLAAVQNGKPIDTTMGFTPASGITMSTRSGEIDPGIVLYLSKKYRLDAVGFNELVNHKSGLLGISGTTADMHELLQSQANDVYAAEAVEIFCYQISKTIGAYAAAMGGINSLIFAGGIGERSAEIRARICENLRFLGIQLDAERNKNGHRLISRDDTDVGVHVIATDEAYELAHLTKKLIYKKGEVKWKP